MNCLIISNLYPSNEEIEDLTGNMLLHRYATHWSKDFKVSVINPHSYNILTARKLKKSNLVPTFELDGISVRNEPILRLPGDFLQVRKFEAIVRSYPEKIDFIIGCLPVGLEIAHSIYRRLGIPYFAYLHITDFYRSGLSKGKLTMRYKKFLGESKGILYVSPKLRIEFEKVIPSQIQGLVLPGAVSDDWFANQNVRKFELSKMIRIITPTRLIKRKNVELVISTLKDIEKLNFSYTIAGDGMEVERLQHLVLTNPVLNERVNFAGMLDHDQLKNQMDLHDLMLLISINESFGLVYLEAMSRGCITIGTRNEGIDGIIKHGENGFLCEPTSEGLKDLLHEIIHLPQSQLEAISKSAIDTVREYTYPSLARSASNFMKSMIQKTSS